MPSSAPSGYEWYTRGKEDEAEERKALIRELRKLCDDAQYYVIHDDHLIPTTSLTAILDRYERSSDDS